MTDINVILGVVLIFGTSYGALKISFYSSLLFKLLTQHYEAEGKKNDRNRVKCNHLYAFQDKNRHYQCYKGMINGGCKNNASKTAHTVFLGKLADKVRPLDKAVILGRSAHHLASYPESVALLLHVHKRLSLILVEHNLGINKLGVLDKGEQLITGG